MSDPASSSPSLPRVPAARGWHWWLDAFGLLREQPLTLLLFGLVYCLIVLGFNVLPGVGNVLAVLCGPLLTVGFLSMAAKLARGEEPMLSDLFAGFRQGVRSLLGIGLWYLVMLMAVAFTVTLLAVLLGIAPGAEALEGDINDAVREQLLMLGLLVLMAALPVAVAYWLAPALVYFQQQTAAEAMRISLLFMWRNLGAFTVYLLVMGALTTASLLTYGAGFVLVAPLSALSIYSCYRDIAGEGPVQPLAAGWVE